MLTFYLFLEPFPLYHYLHFNEKFLFISQLALCLHDADESPPRSGTLQHDNAYHEKGMGLR